MTLVFDENLSPRLPDRLRDSFPEAVHVEHLDLKGSNDTAIWKRAKTMGAAIIVSKDDDFRELALALGPPPKVLILCVGNRATREMESLLRKNSQRIESFANDEEAALLEIYS